MIAHSDNYLLDTPRRAQERNGKIRTFTGRYVNPLKLRASDICIEDIAHHLALTCRYTGACPAPYSVAQHSVLVCNELWGGGAILAMAGLLHDSAEAYFNDIASPVKHDPRMAWYKKLEHETTRMIFCKFGLDPELLAATKGADDAVFKREVNSWWGNPFACSVIPWGWQDAEKEFLYQFHTLESQIDGQSDRRKHSARGAPTHARPAGR